MYDEENPTGLSNEEIWKINVRNLAKLIHQVIPDCVFMLAVVPDRNGKGMLVSHNVHLDNFEDFITAANNLAKSMCVAQFDESNPNRTLN